MPGAKADLEIVARVALAFASAIREAAYIIDPSLEIRLELVSGTEGSLSLNSIIKSIRVGDLLSRRNLITLAFLGIAWFRQETISWIFQEVLDHVSGKSESHQLSEEEIEAIAKKITYFLEHPIAQNQVETVFRILETDPAITGIGASQDVSTKPPFIIPRQEFSARSGATRADHHDIEVRTRDTEEILTLIRPVLLETSDRRWGFHGVAGEFGATIRDNRFITDVLEGRTSIPLVAGIKMAVTLRTVEEKKGGAWHAAERIVLAVHRITSPFVQQGLGLPPGENPPQKP
jgi:hypothetical protein